MVTNFSRMPLRICSTASPITSPRRESSDWALPTSSKSIIVCSALADGRDGLRCEAKVKVVSDWPTLLCDNRRSGGQLPQPWRAPRKSLWQASVEGSVRSAPILYDGLLYVSSLAGFLNALDTRTGKVRWRFKTTAPIHSTPSLNSGQVLVSCDGGTLYAIDSSSGTKTWDVPATGECTEWRPNPVTFSGRRPPETASTARQPLRKKRCLWARSTISSTRSTR